MPIHLHMYGVSVLDLEQEFYEHFQIVPALTPYLQEQCYRLRFEVLCREKQIPGFSAADYPDSLEKDEYDDRSVHYLIYHNESGRYVGTVRLILWDNTNNLMAFPLIGHVHDYIDMAAIRNLPARQIAEISRLVIIKEFRSRIRYLPFKEGTYEDYKKITRINHLVTHPVIGLLAAILKISSENGIKYWVAGMEPSLNKRLSQLGLQLSPLGPLVEYHGMRRPYIGVVDDVVKSLYFNNKEIWKFVTEHGELWPPPVTVKKRPNLSG